MGAASLCSGPAHVVGRRGVGTAALRQHRGDGDRPDGRSPVRGDRDRHPCRHASDSDGRDGLHRRLFPAVPRARDVHHQGGTLRFPSIGDEPRAAGSPDSTRRHPLAARRLRAGDRGFGFGDRSPDGHHGRRHHDRRQGDQRPAAQRAHLRPAGDPRSGRRPAGVGEHRHRSQTRIDRDVLRDHGQRLLRRAEQLRLRRRARDGPGQLQFRVLAIARRDRAVPRPDQHLLERLRRSARRTRGRRHQVGHERASRHGLGVQPERRARRAQLLQHDQAPAEPESVRGESGRPDSQERAVLLRELGVRPPGPGHHGAAAVAPPHGLSNRRFLFLVAERHRHHRSRDRTAVPGQPDTCRSSRSRVRRRSWASRRRRIEAPMRWARTTTSARASTRGRTKTSSSHASTITLPPAMRSRRGTSTTSSRPPTRRRCSATTRPSIRRTATTWPSAGRTPSRRRSRRTSSWDGTGSSSTRCSEPRTSRNTTSRAASWSSRWWPATPSTTGRRTSRPATRCSGCATMARATA